MTSSEFIGQEQAKNQAESQNSAAETARFMLREQVYESMEPAIDFLESLRKHIKRDDVPSIAYCYRKFAAHGKVIAFGCKDLIGTKKARNERVRVLLPARLSWLARGRANKWFGEKYATTVKRKEKPRGAPNGGGNKWLAAYSFSR